MGYEETAVNFETFDGVTLGGTFAYARGETRAVCLFIHGITADRHEWGTFDRIAGMLADRGISSLRFDYRCHGVATEVPDRDLTLSGIDNDIHAAYSALSERTGQQLPLIIVGASFGAGVSARWAQNRYQGTAALLVLLYPVLDYRADLERVNSSWRDELRTSGIVQYGPKALGRPFTCEVATAMMFESLRAAASATIIFHGEDDGDVPVEESVRASQTSPVVKLYRIPGCGHGFAAEDDPDLETQASQRNVAAVVKELEREIERMSL